MASYIIVCFLGLVSHAPANAFDDQPTSFVKSLKEKAKSQWSNIEYITITSEEYVIDKSTNERKANRPYTKYDYVLGKRGEKKFVVTHVSPDNHETVMREIREDGKRRYEILRKENGNIYEINIQHQKSKGLVFSEVMTPTMWILTPAGLSLEQVIEDPNAQFKMTRNDQALELSFENKQRQITCEFDSSETPVPSRVTVAKNNQSYRYETITLAKDRGFYYPKYSVYSETLEDGTKIKVGHNITLFKIEDYIDDANFNIKGFPTRIPVFDETVENRISKLKNLNIDSNPSTSPQQSTVKKPDLMEPKHPWMIFLDKRFWMVVAVAITSSIIIIVLKKSKKYD